MNSKKKQISAAMLKKKQIFAEKNRYSQTVDTLQSDDDDIIAVCRWIHLLSMRSYNGLHSVPL